MQSLLLLVLITTAAYYLGSRAQITAPLWSNYPPTFARFMDCPACSGFWYGVLTGGVFLALGYPLPFDLPRILLSPFLIGWISMVLTPVGAAVFQHAINVNGSAIEPDTAPVKKWGDV